MKSCLILLWVVSSLWASTQISVVPSRSHTVSIVNWNGSQKSSSPPYRVGGYLRDPLNTAFDWEFFSYFDVSAFTNRPITGARLKYTVDQSQLGVIHEIQVVKQNIRDWKGQAIAYNDLNDHPWIGIGWADTLANFAIEDDSVVFVESEALLQSVQEWSQNPLANNGLLLEANFWHFDYWVDFAKVELIIEAQNPYQNTGYLEQDEDKLKVGLWEEQEYECILFYWKTNDGAEQSLALSDKGLEWKAILPDTYQEGDLVEYYFVLKNAKGSFKTTTKTYKVVGEHFKVPIGSDLVAVEEWDGSYTFTEEDSHQYAIALFDTRISWEQQQELKSLGVDHWELLIQENYFALRLKYTTSFVALGDALQSQYSSFWSLVPDRKKSQITYARGGETLPKSLGFIRAEVICEADVSMLACHAAIQPWVEKVGRYEKSSAQVLASPSQLKVLQKQEEVTSIIEVAWGDLTSSKIIRDSLIHSSIPQGNNYNTARPTYDGSNLSIGIFDGKVNDGNLWGITQWNKIITYSEDWEECYFFDLFCDDIEKKLLTSTERNHGTHSAWIVAGSGLNSEKAPFYRNIGSEINTNEKLDKNKIDSSLQKYQFRGFVPYAQVTSYPQLTLFGGYHKDVNNHSFSPRHNDDYFYDHRNIRLDRLVANPGASTSLRSNLVFSAGNNGIKTENGQKSKAGYYGINWDMKNAVIVGDAWNDSSINLSSSLGPTLDGRIKPDVVTSGDYWVSPREHLKSSTKKHGWTSFYGGGTSSAAPAVTGVLAMLMDKYQKEVLKCNAPCSGWQSTAPVPSTWRAMLIHGAKDMISKKYNPLTKSFNVVDDIDLTNADFKKFPFERIVPNPNPRLPPDTVTLYYSTIFEKGPDFATGWGMVRADKSLDLVSESHYKELDLREDDKQEFFVDVNSIPIQGTDHIRFTLAWDDPGEGCAAKHCMTDSKLVNDIDFWVEDPDGKRFYPWKLIPLNRGTQDVEQFITTVSPDSIINHKAYQNCPETSTDADGDPNLSCFDHINNVERIDIDISDVVAAKQGQWKVIVKGRAINGKRLSQKVSLITTAPWSAPKLPITDIEFVSGENASCRDDFTLLAIDVNLATYPCIERKAGKAPITALAVGLDRYTVPETFQKVTDASGNTVILGFRRFSFLHKSYDPIHGTPITEVSFNYLYDNSPVSTGRYRIPIDLQDWTSIQPPLSVASRVYVEYKKEEVVSTNNFTQGVLRDLYFTRALVGHNQCREGYSMDDGYFDDGFYTYRLCKSYTHGPQEPITKIEVGVFKKRSFPTSEEERISFLNPGDFMSVTREQGEIVDLSPYSCVSFVCHQSPGSATTDLEFAHAFISRDPAFGNGLKDIRLKKSLWIGNLETSGGWITNPATTNGWPNLSQRFDYLYFQYKK